jgi:hypothetical protein
VTQPEPIGEGALHLIAVDAPSGVMAALESALHARIRPDDVRRFGECAFLTYCDADPATIRDWLAPVLGDRDSVLVTEFERWSSRGDAIDAPWVLRRGH